jgi:pyruvate-formate lyase
MEWLAKTYVQAMNCIHCMHDKYFYERLEMALHDRDILRTMASTTLHDTIHLAAWKRLEAAVREFWTSCQVPAVGEAKLLPLTKSHVEQQIAN